MRVLNKSCALVASISIKFAFCEESGLRPSASLDLLRGSYVRSDIERHLQASKSGETSVQKTDNASDLEKSVSIGNPKYEMCLGYNRNSLNSLKQITLTTCDQVPNGTNIWTREGPDPSKSREWTKFRWSGDDCIGLDDSNRLAVVSCRQELSTRWVEREVEPGFYTLYQYDSDKCMTVRSETKVIVSSDGCGNKNRKNQLFTYFEGTTGDADPRSIDWEAQIAEVIIEKENTLRKNKILGNSPKKILRESPKTTGFAQEWADKLNTRNPARYSEEIDPQYISGCDASDPLAFQIIATGTDSTEIWRNMSNQKIKFEKLQRLQYRHVGTGVSKINNERYVLVQTFCTWEQ